jgi:SAM-dependent methyltransferase
MKFSSTDDHDLRKRLEEAEQDSFSGWDFSSLQGRMVKDAVPWDFEVVVRQELSSAQALLDMDTGGGEKLAAWKPLPPYTVATEGYRPNVAIARARLEPLGVHVYEVDATEPLPFPADAFSLTTNRHGTYTPAEIVRVLRPGGTFITQQVGSGNLRGLNERLGASNTGNADWALDRARHELEEAGLVITTADEAFPVTRFRDLEAIVYFLKAVSWHVPDFTVPPYFDRLRILGRAIDSHGSTEFTAHRFLLAGYNPW